MKDIIICGETVNELQDTEIIVSNRIDSIANSNAFLNTLKDEFFPNVSTIKFEENK